MLGPVRYLSLAGENASEPQVAVDTDGDAVFTWVRSENDVKRAQVRAMNAAGGLAPVKNLSPAAVGAECPEVAVDADGDAVISLDGGAGHATAPIHDPGSGGATGPGA